jgi:hypothetical protein
MERMKEGLLGAGDEIRSRTLGLMLEFNNQFEGSCPNSNSMHLLEISSIEKS